MTIVQLHYVPMCVYIVRIMWGTCTHYMYGCLCGIFHHGFIAQTHLYFCSSTDPCTQSIPISYITVLVPTCILKTSLCVLFILEADVVCFALYDCHNWQGHHPSHGVSANTQSCYAHSWTAIGHLYTGAWNIIHEQQRYEQLCKLKK